MVEIFDAHYRWLGISPEEQPPSHYRLLGVRRFEPDPDVIESAADKQMTHVRSFQNGPRAAHSQRLLTELAVARVCLLSPNRRATYDAKLKARLRVTEPGVAATPPPPGQPAANQPAPGPPRQSAGTMPCPICGSPLQGKYRKCANCLGDLVWRGGKPHDATPAEVKVKEVPPPEVAELVKEAPNARQEMAREWEEYLAAMARWRRRRDEHRSSGFLTWIVTAFLITALFSTSLPFFGAFICGVIFASVLTVVVLNHSPPPKPPEP